MILYSKSSKFLGCDVRVLKSLGFEDLEDFLKYHDDISEMFVKQDGYIYKHDTFSWINFALHSGSPEKKVLIKTKSGYEIESDLEIIEISLIGDDINYIVILKNLPKYKNRLPNITMDYEEESRKKSYEIDFSVIDDIVVENEESKGTLSTNYTIEDMQTVIEKTENENTNIDDKKYKIEELEHIDKTDNIQIAVKNDFIDKACDNLGLDKDSVLELATEFFNECKENLIKIDKAIKSNDMQNTNDLLLLLGSSAENLYIDDISELAKKLQKILKNDKEEIQKEFKELENLCKRYFEEFKV